MNPEFHCPRIAILYWLNSSGGFIADIPGLGVLTHVGARVKHSEPRGRLSGAASLPGYQVAPFYGANYLLSFYSITASDSVNARPER